MPDNFTAGDNLVFQVESGFGLIRLIAVEMRSGEAIWHVLVYEDFYPDIEQAEAALLTPEALKVSTPHLALTNRAFERTPAAVLGNRPVTKGELAAYNDWAGKEGSEISDRSILQMLGIR